MSYGCLTCRIVLLDLASQREHYKTDWHRVNLNRKADGNLAPVSELEFSAWLDQRNTSLENEDEKKKRKSIGDSKSKGRNENQQKNTFKCSFCQKTFHSEKSLNDHYRSKKHQDNIKESSHESKEILSHNLMEKTSIDAGKNEGILSHSPSIITHLDCLFCHATFPNVEINANHMTEIHGFSIPNRNHLVDLEGLIMLLTSIVGEAHSCLWCLDGIKPFDSIYQVRQHMIDNDHIRLRYDNRTIKAGLGLFYQHDNSSNSSLDKNGNEIIVSETVNNYIKDNDDENSDYTDIDDEMTLNDSDDFENLCVISPDNSQMLLPNGRIISHRHFYKQYSHRKGLILASSSSSPLSITLDSNCSLSDKTKDDSLIKPEHSMHNFPFNAISRELSKRSRKEYCREKSYHEMNVSVKANKLQKHFRQQIL